MKTIISFGEYMNMITFTELEQAKEYFPLDYIVVEEEDSSLISHMIAYDAKHGSVFREDVDVVPQVPNCQMKCNIITSYINSKKEPI